MRPPVPLGLGGLCVTATGRPAYVEEGPGGGSGERQGPGAQGRPRRPPCPAGMAPSRVPAGPSPRPPSPVRGRGAAGSPGPEGGRRGRPGRVDRVTRRPVGLWAGSAPSRLPSPEPRSTMPSLRNLQCGAGGGPPCDRRRTG
jgi:hypothetical protein